MWNALLDILYPKLCIGCNRSLVKNESFICGKCLVHLPETRFREDHNNIAEKIFWGRVAIEHAYAYLYFRKGNITQKLLHELKYHGNKELGIFLGKLFGEKIQNLDEPIDA
ncbi:MAG: ComF family protein, partial [Bacteroidia bacterium]